MEALRLEEQQKQKSDMEGAKRDEGQDAPADTERDDADDRQNDDDYDNNRDRSRNTDVGKSPSDDDFTKREEAATKGVTSQLKLKKL